MTQTVYRADDMQTRWPFRPILTGLLGLAFLLAAATAAAVPAVAGIEIETRTLDEVQAVVETGGVEVILLDNMVTVQPDGAIDTSLLQEAVALVDGRIATEASGNVTLATVPAIAATGVTYISCGALTHSVKALDLSLKIELET